MTQPSINIIYVKDRNGRITAERETGSIDTSRGVSEILQLLGSMKQLGPDCQLFICADPGKRLSDLGIQPGSTIIIMGK